MDKGGCDDYNYKSVAEAFRKVLCDRKPHFERCSVWTHWLAAAAVASVLAAVHASSYFASSGGDATLSRVAGWSACVTFAVSATFHVLRTVDAKQVPYVAAVAYATDQICVFVTLTLSAAANTAAWVGVDRDWRTVADPLIAGAACTAFVLVRHFFYDSEPFTTRYPTIGVCRSFAYDGMHGVTSSACGVCIALGVYVCAPVLYVSVPDDTASAVLGASTTSLVLMVVGRSFESGTGTGFEDSLEKTMQARAESGLSIVAKRVLACGAVITGHALWHVLSMFASCVDVVQRELALAERVSPVS